MQSPKSLALQVLEIVGKKDHHIRKLHEEVLKESLPAIQFLKESLQIYEEIRNKDSHTQDELERAVNLVVMAVRGNSQVMEGPKSISQLRHHEPKLRPHSDIEEEDCPSNLMCAV